MHPSTGRLMALLSELSRLSRTNEIAPGAFASDGKHAAFTEGAAHFARPAGGRRRQCVRHAAKIRWRGAKPGSERRNGESSSAAVMPGLVPGIHLLVRIRSKTWIAGTSPAMTSLQVGASAAAQSASGFGLIWKCTAIGVMPKPPSWCQGTRSPLEVHKPRPFQPIFGSSMRPSRPLA